MISNLEIINKHIALIKESGIPVEHLTSIDTKGNFTVKEPQCSEDYSKYVGKVMYGGVLSIFEKVTSYPCDYGCYTTTSLMSLKAYNINGYDFEANAYTTSDSIVNTIEHNATKITTLYSHYKAITDALDNGVTDDFIKDEFGLTSFKSSKNKVKNMYLRG